MFDDFKGYSARLKPDVILVKAEPKKKEYSWDKKRREVDLSKFTVENVLAGEVGRAPGEINGETRDLGFWAVS